MTIRRPTPQDVKRLAEANNFELTDAELSAFEALIPGLFDSFDDLAQLPEQRPALRYPNRDPGSRPRPEDDPYNAILRRCYIRGATGGKLVGKRIGLKNNISVSGFPLTCASRILEHYVADSDATIVTWISGRGGGDQLHTQPRQLRLFGGWRHERLRPDAQSAQPRPSGRGIIRGLRCRSVLRRY